MMMNLPFSGKFYWYFAIVLLMAILPMACNTQKLDRPGGITFIGTSFDQALQQARAQNKYIFVDAYASWCGPCKLLKAITFRNKKAADFYNKNFINVSIDMEQGEGPALADQWGIQAYPTLIIFNPKGEPVLASVGYIGARDLVKFGQQGLTK